MAKPDHPHPLHRGRLERGLSIADIAASTRLPPSMVTKIDEGRFEELPAGVYARGYVRAFAAAVGVDPARVLRDLDGLLPEAPDPFPLLREIKQAAQPRRRREWLLPRWFGAAVDAAALLAIERVRRELGFPIPVGGEAGGYKAGPVELLPGEVFSGVFLEKRRAVAF